MSLGERKSHCNSGMFVVPSLYIFGMSFSWWSLLCDNQLLLKNQNQTTRKVMYLITANQVIPECEKNQKRERSHSNRTRV